MVRNVDRAKYRIRGMPFQLPCCATLVWLVAKGDPIGKKRKSVKGRVIVPGSDEDLELNHYMWKGVICPHCSKTRNPPQKFQVSLQRNTDWMTYDLPDPYPNHDHCLFQLDVDGVHKWRENGRPEWRL